MTTGGVVSANLTQQEGSPEVTTSESAIVFDREALRCWLSERELRPAAFARAIGHDRATVHRWLVGDWQPEIPLHLIQQGLALGAAGQVWDSERLRRWMTREVYDGATLAADLGMHRTTVGRWLGAMKVRYPMPYWLPIALAAIEGDVAARRTRRRALRLVARAS